MKLPRYSATTSPPRISGAARATDTRALVRSSDIEKWQAVGAVGQALSYAGGLAFQAHQHRQALDDTIEWGTATSRVKDRFRLAAEAAERMDVSMDMPEPDDPDYLKTLASFSTIKRDQFLTEALKDIEKDVGKLSQGFSNPKNKADFESWYKDNYDNLANDVRSMYTKKLDSYQRSEISRLSETAAENGDVATADHFVELMDKYELITPERAEALKKNNKVIADTSITYRSARAIMALEGRQKAIEFVMKQDIDVEIKKDIVSDINFEVAQQRDRLEILSEEQKDKISRQISNPDPKVDTIELIEASKALTEDEQWTWKQRYHAEAKRLADGEEIITDNGVRTELYNDIMGILSLSKTKKEVLEKAKAARFDPKKPTLSETDYNKLETAIHAQYEQAYGQGMGKVARHAEGLLLNPDSLGYIKNAPIRYKILGDFNEAWLKWIASKGDTLKVSEIYPEGRRMAANFQISDQEAERQEVEMNEKLRAKEEGKKAAGDEVEPTSEDLDAYRRMGLKEYTSPSGKRYPLIPQPKTKEEYDKLKPGTKYIDPEGVERTKK